MLYKKLSAALKGFILGLLSTSIAMVVFAQAPKTIENLNKAFEGEANANHKYEVFAQKATEEGQNEIAKLFRAISKSESIHMNNHKDVIVKLNATPAEIKLKPVAVDTTKQNLSVPIKGEKQENEIMYPEFIKQAQADNERDAVRSFLYAKKAEKQHEKLFQKALRDFGKNKPVDYCVSKLTGATYSINIDANCPIGRYKNEEEYIKIK